MASKPDIQTVLEELLGSRNVYLQPPENEKMSYPAIRYSLDDIQVNNANDSKYAKFKGYQLILLDYDPDSVYIDKILDLPYCHFVNFYTKDGLNHFVFKLYY